ncbi:NAD(P)-binding protein [Hortaea werneckii]|uniref:NAD-dependent epimerase/dehydratase domain-containing protein n=1 Tax=Hortaea werneckii TaxID=91943 RepID=A0A3M7G232_HORWE|nr:NAD(P)-binding protein [Hortaea werneckii]KAI6879312.1 NAD(P)-binding protein [Hortaea werneckii]KAI6987233.1 NAD(P)-binding protein [Hortaea werneckii]KAI7141364.1 NAD(P)-binding protein [Hortaea werneckii]KAI7179973.1 NAD(P)-binding protein [Hortaea werneckii]
MRVLLTGGSGFIAAHVLDILLQHGHSVVTTVRSQDKAKKIADNHAQYGRDKLSFAIVEDIAKEGAFDEAVVSDPPFETVIHTASPFHFNVTDVQKELLDPAIIGTTGILKSIKKSAPSVKRVVITSSFASIINPYKGSWPEHTYTETDWNPITPQQAIENPANGYRASKTFAERAAWDFLEKEKPNFSIATMCPPLVLGPIVHYLNSLDALNTSNQRVRDIMMGKAKDEIPPTGTFIWVDVRDLALCHVLAMEKDGAANKRFFITTGYFSNKEIAEIIGKNFPQYKEGLPSASTPGGGYPEEGVYKVDNSNVVNTLGVKFRPLEESIVDTVKSLQAVGA